jgi:hypothetical protein
VKIKIIIRGQTKMLNWRIKLNWKISLMNGIGNQNNKGQIKKNKTIKTLIKWWNWK